MTSNTFEEAKKILKKIEYVEKLKSWIWQNPIIKKNKDDYEFLYLSIIDNENKELETIIRNWCEQEIKRLQEIFEKL